MGKPKEKRQPEKIDLSKISKRYIEVPVPKHIEKKVYPQKVIRAWENTGKRTTSFMEKIGNIKLAWHGTKEDSIADIAQEFLRLGWKGAFGGGIYSSPNISKALGYTGYNSTGYLLEVKVALGREFHPTETGNYEQLILDGEYDSVVASRPSALPGWYGKVDAPEEYVVFRTEQAAIQSVYEIGGNAPEYIWAPKNTDYLLVWRKRHPCKRLGFICLNACNPLKSMGRICIIGKKNSFCSSYKRGAKVE